MSVRMGGGSGSSISTPVTAPNGGTGQTTYTKGDLLVGNGSSGLDKLAVGADGRIPIANASATDGIDYYDALSRPDVISGQYIQVPGYAATSSFSFAINTIYFAPILVKKRTTFTDFGFSTIAVTAASYKIGIYADGGGKPTGTTITNSATTGGPFTTVSVTNQSIVFGTPVALNPGWYWLAIVTDVTGTITSVTTGTGNHTGIPDFTSNVGPRILFASTYAGGLPDMTANTVTRTAASGVPFMGLKVQ